MIQVTCQCGTRLQLDDQWAGQQGRCPRCHGVLQIPQATAAPAPGTWQFAPPMAAKDTPPPSESPAPARTSLPSDSRPPPAAPSPVAEPSRPPAAARRPRTAPSPPPAAAPIPPAPDAASPDAWISAEDLPEAEPKPPPKLLPSQPLDVTALRRLLPRTLVFIRRRRLALIGAAAAGGVLVLLLLAWPYFFGGRRVGTTIAQGQGTGPSAGLLEPLSEDELPLPGASPLSAPADSPSPPGDPDPSPAAEDGNERPVPPREPAAAPAVAASDATGTQAATSRPKTSSGSPPRSFGPSGLTGVSTQYDDMHCRRLQQQFGIRVPAASNLLEVDGQRLLVTNLSDLQRSPAPYLFLPRGIHTVRWRIGEQSVKVEIDKDWVAEYQQMRAFFRVGGEIRREELMSRGARAMDVYQAPFLLNFAGAADVAEQRWEAAERKFRRAIRVNPLFSPAHLNLAHCLARRGAQEAARRELALADAFNVGNVFGLNAAIAELRGPLGLSHSERQTVQFQAGVYVSEEPLAEADERLVALLTAASRYAVREEDRGKILNNLGAHFADTGRPELALEYFRSALEALTYAGPERFGLARSVFAHMSAACRTAGFPEAEEYDWMQDSVLP